MTLSGDLISDQAKSPLISIWFSSNLSVPFHFYKILGSVWRKWLSLLIWPDPGALCTPQPRRTSSQRPESQILTFKVLHKLHSTLYNVREPYMFGNGCWLTHAEPRQLSHYEYFWNVCQIIISQNIIHTRYSRYLVVFVKKSQINETMTLWCLLVFMSSSRFQCDRLRHHLRKRCDITWKFLRHDGDEPPVPHTDPSQWRRQVSRGGELQKITFHCCGCHKCCTAAIQDLF